MKTAAVLLILLLIVLIYLVRRYPAQVDAAIARVRAISRDNLLGRPKDAP